MKFVLASLVGAMPLGQADTRTPKNLNYVTISVLVQGAKTDQVYSYVTREICSLKDVQVIEDKDEADYNISILVLEPKINSTAVGYFSVSSRNIAGDLPIPPVERR